MDYIRKFYISFKLIINPPPPIKPNYYYPSNNFNKYAKHKPNFLDEFNNFKPIKYNFAYNNNNDEELL